MHTNVMIDLETLGTKSGSVILSIGAVAFSPGQPEEEWSTFDSGAINVAASRKVYGLRIDEDALAWWLRQEPAAMQVLHAALEGGVMLVAALGAFTRWFPKKAKVWGNGANFDNVLLRVAFEAASLACPWPYYDDHCYRTMKTMFSGVPKPEFQGIKHNALTDALHQTRHLQAILKAVNDAQ